MKTINYKFLGDFGRIFLFMVLLISALSYSQTTLATYDFTDNLNPNAGAIGTPTLKYFNSAGVQITPSYVNGTNGSRVLNTNDQGSYVELTIDTSGYSGINISWYGEVNYGFLNQGDWDLYANTGSGYGGLLLKMDLFNFIIFIANSRTENFTLNSSADNNSTLKIKIKCSNLSSNIRLDKLVITSRSPKINVFGYNTTNALTQIPVNSPAATIYGTDFGIVITSSITSTGYSDRVFRIQNNGAAALNISAINFTGLNAGDFSIFGPLPTTVNSLGGTEDFTVRFNPSSDGKSTALLNVFSNANPSPYSYEVEGRGASCSSNDIIFKNNTIETVTQSLPAVPNVGNSFYIINGSNAVNSSSTMTSNTSLYGPTNGSEIYSLFTSSNSSWYVKSETSTINFGPVDVTNEKGVFISFNLAAFALNTGTTFNNNDVVTLEVLKPGTTNTWSNELEIRGNNFSPARKSRFSFNSGILLEGIYDGDGMPVVGIGNYSTIKLKLFGSSNFSDLVFRITSSSSNANKLWLIDDVSVSTANSVFKTYTGTGTTGWKNSANNDTTVPIIEEKAIINASFTGDLTACECEVLPGKSVLVNAGNLVKLENKLNNNGSFTIESEGILIQNDNTAINSGNINVKRDIQIGALRNQYNYLGSPVAFMSGETFKTIYPGITQVLYHNQANNNFYTSSGVNIPGRGMAVKEPTLAAVPVASKVIAQYKGVPQNGEIIFPLANNNISLTTLGYNLLGNPYPSNINLQKLYDLNGGKTGSSQIISPNISATFYLWDNNGNSQTTQQGSGYSGQAYAIFNVLSGVNGMGTKSLLGTKVPTNTLKVGQGFMTRSLLNAYNLKFDNSIRTTATSSVDFLGKDFSENPENRYWLKMTSPSGMTSTIGIVHFGGGNNLFGAEDSRSMGGSDAIYTLVEEEKLAIDGRSNLLLTDKILLGTQHFTGGNYKIEIDAVEGIFSAGQNIYLKDNQTGIITNLSQGSYTFQANAGESTGRFEIIYKPETVLATNGEVKNDLVVYRAGNDFVVKAQRNKITNIEIYESSGRLILKMQPNEKNAVIFAETFLRGVYILKINQGGQITSKKIIK